ncbi:hypothetical protein, partial [Bradyrhizobium sp. CCBAU 45394]|uniref:hypothetical protein n=1 Tax=Bradyrhizobium sp. CCBAU 45394 TaxID=1325087 RepID=UPI002302CEE5
MRPETTKLACQRAFESDAAQIVLEGRPQPEPVEENVVTVATGFEVERAECAVTPMSMSMSPANTYRALGISMPVTRSRCEYQQGLPDHGKMRSAPLRRQRRTFLFWRRDEELPAKPIHCACTGNRTVAVERTTINPSHSQIARQSAIWSSIARSVCLCLNLARLPLSLSLLAFAVQSAPQREQQHERNANRSAISADLAYDDSGLIRVIRRRKHRELGLRHLGAFGVKPAFQEAGPSSFCRPFDRGHET